MLDVYTLPISRSEVGSLLANAGQDHSFRIRTDQHNHLTFRTRMLPSLDSYRINDFPSIEIEYDTPAGLHNFWATTRRLVNKSIFSLCYLGVSESGAVYDAVEERDVELRFGFDFCAPVVVLATGGVTPAAKDLSYRSDLFNRFLRALGLSGQLETLIVDGELDMRVHGQRFRNAKDFPHNTLPQLRSSGTLFYEGRHTNTKGRDFCDLVLYCHTLEELEQKVPNVVQALGGESRIVASTFGVASTKENYPQVREILNDCPLGPWRISLTAIGRYSLENLDDAVAENESFLFRAFTLDPPGIGEVDVDISYDKGSFSLHFYCVYESNEQERALHDLIIQFAGGEDIIDHALL